MAAAHFTKKMLRLSSKTLVRSCKSSLLSNSRATSFAVRAASTSANGEQTNDVLIYTGLFAGKMKWLRRISLGSTFLSTCCMPLAMTVQSGLLPMAAQIALVGTVMFSSFSSTLLLQVVAHPYVCTLHEVVPVDPTTEVAPEDRQFKATRYNVFGQPVVTEFSLKQADRNVSNPFSSFQVKPAGFFYIFGGEIQDTKIRQALTKEG